MIAFISDIHSNLPALDAALADIHAQGIKRIVCLGDIVGYGGSPLETIERVQETCELSLKGNHDEVLMREGMANYFNAWARDAIMWTKDQVDASDQMADLYDFFYSLKAEELFISETGKKLKLVHASPRDPLTEYLLPNLTPDGAVLRANFDILREGPRICFYGHTHHPGYFQPGESFLPAKDGDTLEIVEGDYYLINVGSVGQPRDRNPQLSYVILEGDIVHWRRVDYDIALEQETIVSAGLPQKLSDRLAIGR